MDKPSQLDWTQVQIFLAVAETGSLSGAADMLGSSQPTIGRHVRDMEARLGTTLFHRQTRGLELTETATALIAPAQAMRAAMQQFNLTAAGRDQRLEGTVRITASVFVSHYVLPAIIAKIREAEPEISIDLIPSDSSENLLFREADIAVRMYRSTQLDVITKHLGDIRIGLFAARSYLDRRGRPMSMGSLIGHDLIGYDTDDRIIRGMRQAGIPAERSWFKVRCDAQANYWELVRAGCGIGFSQVNAAQTDLLVEQIMPWFKIPMLPVWLAAPEAMRQTPRIARVWELLEEGLRPKLV